MALSPDSPRVSVSSDTRAPRPRLSTASTPPCSSSGCAVVCITLAVVRSFRSRCHAAATPDSAAGACAPGDGAVMARHARTTAAMAACGGRTVARRRAVVRSGMHCFRRIVIRADAIVLDMTPFRAAWPARAIVAVLALATLAAGSPSAPTASTAPAAGVQALTASGGINRPEQRGKPYVILVSFDGFRPDYLDRFDLPNFNRVLRRGARARAL